jgi:hypothetical protein
VTSPAPGVDAPRRRTGGRHLAVLLGFVVLAGVLFLPADLHATGVLIGATTADNSQHAWFLRWLPYAIATHHNPLFTTSIVEPAGVNLMWNTWIPLPALVLAPVTLLAGPVAAFDLAVTIGVALSAWCTYLAASRFVHRPAAAVLAGVAYGFSPFMLDQAYAGHSNMVIAFVPPLMLLALDTVLVRQEISARRAGLLLGALMTVQFYITEEVLASEAVMAMTAAICLAVIGRDQLASRWRYVARALRWSLALFAPLAAYPIWFQFFGPEVPGAVLSDKNFFVTDLLNTVLPSTAQGFEPSFAAAVATHYAGNSGEWVGYIGIPMLAVVAGTLWRGWRRPLVRTLGISAAVALVLSFGSTLHVGGTDTHIPLPGAVLAHLPIVDNLLAARFALYVALCTALLFGIFVDGLPAGRRGLRVTVISAVLVALTFVPPLPFPSRAVVTPAYFTASPSPITTAGAVLVVPLSHDFYSTQAMLWQAESGMAFSMPEGYIINRQPSGAAGQGPPPSVTSATLSGIAAGTMGAGLTPRLRNTILAELRGWDITTVVLGPMDSRSDTMRAFLSDLLGGPPALRDGVAVWASVPAPS